MSSQTARRVLIVDDSRAIQAIIRRALECEELGPMQIQTACDGAEALDKVESFRPDLVLSDWHMPGVSGIEMLQTLRQTGHGHVPVGFVTTENRAERLDQARSNGAVFVLPKPFDDRALRQAVRHSFGQPSRPSLLTPRPSTAEMAPPRPAAAGALESLAQLQQLLFTHLGTRSFDLLRAEHGPELAHQVPQLIALYGSAGRKGAYALGLLDLQACCLIGGMAAGCSPAEIQQAIQAEKPAPKQIEHASRFMRALAAQLKKRSPADAPALSAARLTQQPFDKLPALLNENLGRSDLTLRINGITTGRLCLLLV